MNTVRLLCTGLAVLFAFSNLFTGTLVAQEGVDGLKCPDGFKVTHFSDDVQASDIYCMTIDSRGRVVVAGADYIRILIDSDQDGVADESIDYATPPKGGVQGMCFDGNDLICSAGGGVIRYQDANGDDRADGPARLLFNIKTGAEHDSHAIRKGPDGWWYLIAGNFAGVKTEDINSSTSPVKKVRAGVIMRFSPDFSRREVFADGFRNAYDFDFDALGNLFTFDSDGERDVTLPWYRPTRVFHVTPGSDAGYISRSWKMPNHYFEMPDTIAELGRGSPTGVACYLHNQFPETYHNAIFVLDWTFGTVRAIKTSIVDGKISGDPELFLEGKGAFGFAPTDIEIGVDGSLYVSVGGRGTRGSVYRISWIGDQKVEIVDVDPLARCLTAKQPRSSSSRATWEPLAKKLGRDTFVTAAADATLPVDQRCRAAEILADVFAGVDKSSHALLLEIDDPVVLSRVAWMLGRTGDMERDSATISRLMQNRNLIVKLELLRGMSGKGGIDTQIASALLLNLHSDDRTLRQAASRFLIPARVVLNRSDDDPTRIEKLYAAEWLALVVARDVLDTRCLQAGIGFFQDAETDIDQLDAVRLMQIGLGNCGPREGVAPVFEGYVSERSATPITGVPITVLRDLIGLFPSGSEQVDFEMARLISMAGLNSPSTVKKMLAKINEDSDPVSDIHYLICIANMSAAATAEDRAKISAAFVALQPKIETADLNQDSNWEPRIEELFNKHQSRDPLLLQSVSQSTDFGHPAHSLFLKGQSAEFINTVIPKFIAYQEKLDRPLWTSELLRYLADSPQAEHRQLVRNQFEDPGCRDDVVLTLARRPNEIDRAIFVSGLDSPEPTVIGASLNALNVMRPSREADEQVALVKALQRIGGEKSDYEAREQIVRMLQKNTGISFGFQFGTAGHRPQTEVVNQWVSLIKRSYPDRADQLEPAEGIGLSEVAALMKTVPWQNGNAANGERLFEERACAKCHGKRNRLGPDLAGVTKRFSKNDLFHSILAPSSSVSSRYRTKVFETIDGKSYTGMVIYESVEGVLLRTANNETIRLETDEIESSEYLSRSLMPANLLDNLTSQEYADLYAFLQQQ